MSLIASIASALARLFGFLEKALTEWTRVRQENEGAEKVRRQLKEAQDEKIKRANAAAADSDDDELLLAPKDRNKD